MERQLLAPAATASSSRLSDPAGRECQGDRQDHDRLISASCSRQMRSTDMLLAGYVDYIVPRTQDHHASSSIICTHLTRADPNII
jgi:hypothetical protein